MPELPQFALFSDTEWWREYWRGMPEFVQEDLEPFKTLFVHFETRRDLEDFEKLVGQQINLTTKSIWYPEMGIERFTNRRYIDEGTVYTPVEEKSAAVEIARITVKQQSIILNHMVQRQIDIYDAMRMIRERFGCKFSDLAPNQLDDAIKFAKGEQTP